MLRDTPFFYFAITVTVILIPVAWWFFSHTFGPLEWLVIIATAFMAA